MATDNPTLTTEQRFAALAPSLAWYIPRLLDRGTSGQHCRRAAVDFLAGQQQLDADRGVDLVARGMFAEVLRRYDSAADRQADQAATADSLMRLLRAMQPNEVATLIDGSVPPVVLERQGSATDALTDLEAKHAEGNLPEEFDGLDEDDVTESAMPFSEGQPAEQPMRPRAKRLSPADAERVAAESMRRHGFGSHAPGQ